MLGGEPLDSVGPGKQAPFRRQQFEAFPFFGDLRLDPGDFPLPAARCMLEPINEISRHEQPHDQHGVDKPQHHPCPPAVASARSPALSGLAGASVLTAALSLADLARGLRATSSSVGVTGPRPRNSKLGAGTLAAGRWRDGRASRALRSVRNLLAIRSSSE